MKTHMLLACTQSHVAELTHQPLIYCFNYKCQLAFYCSKVNSCRFQTLQFTDKARCHKFKLYALNKSGFKKALHMGLTVDQDSWQ